MCRLSCVRLQVSMRCAASLEVGGGGGCHLTKTEAVGISPSHLHFVSCENDLSLIIPMLHIVPICCYPILEKLRYIWFIFVLKIVVL